MADRDIYLGKHLAEFSSGAGLNALDSRCLSLQSPTAQLHLEAETAGDRDAWFAGLSLVLQGAGKVIVETGADGQHFTPRTPKRAVQHQRKQPPTPAGGSVGAGAGAGAGGAASPQQQQRDSPRQQNGHVQTAAAAGESNATYAEPASPAVVFTGMPSGVSSGTVPRTPAFGAAAAAGSPPPAGMSAAEAKARKDELAALAVQRVTEGMLFNVFVYAEDGKKAHRVEAHVSYSRRVSSAVSVAVLRSS
jgi:hypothetical protein